MKAKKYWILASLTGVILLSLMVVVLLMGANISANDKVIKKGIPDSAHKRANPTYSEVERLREKVKSLKVVIANRDEEIAKQKRTRTRWGSLPGLRASLVGLRSVGIRVKDLPLTAVRHGLTKKNIVKAVKEEFKKHNIDTINVDTDPSEDSHEELLVRMHIMVRPQLHIEVICGTFEGGIYNAFIIVSMESRSSLSYASGKDAQRGSAVIKQGVPIEKTIRSEDRTTIWERRHVLLGKLDNFAEDERNSLEELVDEFINDYLAANPTKGKDGQAILDYSKAIEIGPSNAEAYFNRGLAYAKQGQRDYNNKGLWDRAISDFTKVIEIEPSNAEAYYNRGDAYGHRGEHYQAIQDYTKALEINPRLVDAYLKRGKAYETYENEYDLAIADFTKVIEIEPSNAEAYYNRGWAYESKDEYDQAIQDYTKARSLGHQVVDQEFLKEVRKSKEILRK